MSNETFNFNAFIKESKDSIMNPKEYFSTMKTEGGLGEPIIKALIYGTLSGIIAFIWSLLNIGVVGGSIFGGAVGIMALVGSVIVALIGVFIGGVIILVLSAICGGKTDFEPNIRVSASLMVLMPINSLFAFSGVIHQYLWILISLVIFLYSLWMLYQALTQTLKGKEATAKIISLVLIAIVVIFSLVGLAAKKAVNRFEDYGKDYIEVMEKQAKEMEKAAKEMEKEMEEKAKELEKAMEELEKEQEEEEKK